MAGKIPYRHKGNEDLFLAVEMSLVSTLAGIPLHVHAEGLRGTGKTTVMRCASQFLPRIIRIKGCPYQCEPERPHCPQHSRLPADAQDRWEPEEVPMPFVEIGHAAKLGSVVGSIDLARLTDPAHPEAHLLPGTIPQASRGIVFVDEINRLAETAPEITDVLLSVMGTKPGKLRIEETGLPPVELEVKVSVWAASNPDEDPGPLEHVRRQLADRFDLVVAVNRPSDPDVVESMLVPAGERYLSGQQEPEPFRDLEEKARRFRNVVVARPILRYIAELYVTKNIESLRAAEALELCSRLAAAIRGRNYVIVDDLALVAPMVLRHRVEPIVLAEVLKDMEARKQAAGVESPSQLSRGSSTPPPGDPSSPSRQERGECERGSSSDTAPVPGLWRPGSSPKERPGQESTAAGYRTGPVCAGQGSARCQRLTGREGFLDRVGRLFRRRAGSVTPASSSSPLETLPLSPPDPARPISLIHWEEMILPGAWRVLEEEARSTRRQ